MPLIKKIYVCSICYSEYMDHNEAVLCESKGLPLYGGSYKEGDIIKYQDENYAGNDYYYYLDLKNKIILRKVLKIENKHTWSYVVEQNVLGLPTKEKIVIPDYNEFDYNEFDLWIAPYNLEYKLGFAKTIKELKFENI